MHARQAAQETMPCWGHRLAQEVDDLGQGLCRGLGEAAMCMHARPQRASTMGSVCLECHVERAYSRSGDHLPPLLAILPLGHLQYVPLITLHLRARAGTGCPAQPTRGTGAAPRPLSLGDRWCRWPLLPPHCSPSSSACAEPPPDHEQGPLRECWAGRGGRGCHHGVALCLEAEQHLGSADPVSCWGTCSRPTSRGAMLTGSSPPTCTGTSVASAICEQRVGYSMRHSQHALPCRCSS